MDKFDSSLAKECSELLKRWGRWARTEENTIGFPHQTPFRRLLGGSIGHLMMSDDEGMQIAEKVAELKKEDEAAYRVVELYYIKDLSIRGLQHSLGLRTLHRAWKLKLHTDDLMAEKLYNILN